MNGPISPGEPGFGGSPFPAFPGHQRKTDLEEETQIVSRMEGMDINQGPGPRGPPARGPMGPPPPRGGPQYPDQRRGPPGPGYGGYQDDGFGPPERSMTMPARDPMEMRQAPPPHRSETAPYNPSRGMPGRPNTAQGMRGQPPQRGYPPNDGYTEPGYDNPRAPQQRPASFDDFYDYYDSGNGGSNYPPQNPPSASSEVPPNFDAMGPQPGGRNSFDQHMEAAPGPREFGGPGRLPELNRTKSQPDLRSSQTAVFEMAGDVPPIPNEYQGQPGPGFQGGLPSGPNARRMSPPGGLPTGPAPYRPGAQPQGGPNPDSLPSHPTPVRPGLMPNSVVNLSNKPPPVRNYGNTQPQQNMMPQQQQQQQQQGPPPPASQMTGHGAAPAKPVEAPVTIQELEHLRAVVKADATDQASALRLAKRLVEAADVLVPNLPDPKSRGRARERYLLDAQKILKKLASASNPDAMFFLADSLGRGLFSGEPDNKEAFTLYQSSAKLGHAAAAYRTAVCCEIGNEEGGGTRKDPLKAIQWYKRAATLGDTPAMYKVGMILLKGLLGQPRNPREAVGWLKRAAERADTENPHALHELGLLYESAQPNDAILRDEPYAFTLFKKAAELGYKFSQFRLGCAYEYGLMGCPIDPRLSIMWYSRAATQEEHQSELALSGWYLTGSDGVLSQSDTEAYLWARKAAVAGLAKAEYAMGYFTEVGIGVPANLEDAKRWYWRAAAQDFPKARERLEDLKRSGKNGPRARERISRSKIGKQQEGECSVM
ncbi:HCP-like protein [Thozetella sp. PMI_491]|nr:HCP-like protein [Thozetella sp. PMI_491]